MKILPEHVLTTNVWRSCKMPRSNKKKSPLKPPIDDPIYQKHESFNSANNVIETLLKNEKNTDDF